MYKRLFGLFAFSLLFAGCAFGQDLSASADEPKILHNQAEIEKKKQLVTKAEIEYNSMSFVTCKRLADLAKEEQAQGKFADAQEHYTEVLRRMSWRPNRSKETADLYRFCVEQQGKCIEMQKQTDPSGDAESGKSK
jgi:hypothetical protein